MTNKKKGKQQKVPNDSDHQSATRSHAQEPLPASDGTYAKYKRCTDLVHEWCDAVVGMSTSTLRDWSLAMDSIARRGEQMPAEVRDSLNMAIALRDKANAFYKAIQAADADQHRHWYVCRLLRQFRRLFSPRKTAQPCAPVPSEEQPSASSSMGFEALAIEDPLSQDDSDDDNVTVLDLSDEHPSGGNAALQEDDLLFAFACLMTDAGYTRDEVKQAWAKWDPSSEHCSSLLGAVSEANFAVAKLERIVNALQLTLGLPDANLGTLMGLAPSRVCLHGLQAKPELNGRRGVLGSRDLQSGRYPVTLDNADEGAPPVLVRPANLRGEYGWEARSEALPGILQQVGRSLADFDHNYMPPVCQVDVDMDHSRLLEKYVCNGSLWQWTNYAQGIGRYGASETLWRRQMRDFVAQREAKKGSREVSFVVAFIVAASIETTVDRLAAGVDVRPIAIGSLVMRELKFNLVKTRVALASAPLSDRSIAHELKTNLSALEMVLESEPTVQSNVWLAGDVLDIASRITFTHRVLWGHQTVVTVMVHLYHALRYCGHLRAIAEVDAMLRMLRKSVFFRTDQLPARGGFGKAVSLAIGATVSSVKKGAPELKHGRTTDRAGINPAETSLLRYVSQFGGAGMDTSQLDFQAIAREEVAVLHTAPTLAGITKILRVQELMTAAGLREATVLKAADEGAPSMLGKAAAFWEQVFPGSACAPPAPETTVSLEFSSYTQLEPIGGLKGAHTSSYVPAHERLTKEQLKQKYRDGNTAVKEGTIRVETW